MSYERIHVIGNIGKTEVKTSRSGMTYVSIRLAVNRGSDKTVWYSVLLFGKFAENTERIKQLYKPGRLILAEGKPDASPYKRENGTIEVDNTITAITMPELLDKPPTGANSH